MRTRFPQVRYTLVMMLACLLLAGCGQKNVYQPGDPPTVTVAKPLVQTITNYLEETGTTEAVEKVEIRARVRGFLERIDFQPNDIVQKGKVLYAIEKQLYDADVKKVEAAVQVALADYKNTYARYKRGLTLYEKRAMTKEELDERLAQVEIAKAGGLAAQAQLREALIMLGYTDVITPITGRVDKTLVKLGNLVDGNAATHLTTVTQYDPIYANFNISERVVKRLLDEDPEARKSNRQKLRVYLQREGDQGYPFEGRIDYSGLGVDTSTGTYPVRGVFPNPDLRIVPGMFVRVRVPINQEENALLIPEIALGADQLGRFVLVLAKDDMVARRDVSLGSKHGNMQVIASGLEADDWVIIQGTQRARAGAKVTPTKTELTSFDEKIARASGEDATKSLKKLPDKGASEDNIAPGAPKPGDQESSRDEATN